MITNSNRSGSVKVKVGETDTHPPRAHRTRFGLARFPSAALPSGASDLAPRVVRRLFQ